jgi:hypothetical protein
VLGVPRRSRAFGRQRGVRGRSKALYTVQGMLEDRADPVQQLPLKAQPFSDPYQDLIFFVLHPKINPRL